VLSLGLLLAGAAAQRPPARAPAAFTMQGELETVTNDALSFRASDGSLFEILLPAGGALAVPGLGSGHAVGDEIAVEAAFIAPQFVPADNEFFELRLTAIKFLHPGSGRDLRAALASPAWRVSDNRVSPPAGAVPPALAPSPPGDAFLRAARQAVLNYAAQLPNFLVTEAVTRTTLARGATTRDRIESELAVAGNQEQRGNIRLNGKAWPHPYAQLPGLRWTSDYAERLRPIFLPACGAVLKPRGASRLQGEEVEVYSFRLPPSLCAGRIQAGPAWAYPGFEGKVYISAASHLVMRVEQRYTGLPASFAEAASQDATDWAPAWVAGARWLLPTRSRLTAAFRDGESVKLEVEYRDYRRFETSSHMTIVGPAPAVPAQ
jgi:hypothetical protein